MSGRVHQTTAGAHDGARNKKPGCTLLIKCNRLSDSEPLDEDAVSDWLSGRSGLTRRHADRITEFTITPTSAGDAELVRIRFEASVNCFEAMRQLRKDTVVDRRIAYIRCPCGWFVRLTVRPCDRMSGCTLQEAELREFWRPYGDIYSVEYLKSNGIRTGRIEVLMFMTPENYTKLERCDPEKQYFEEIEFEYFYPEDDRVSAKFVQQIWQKYGPK